MICLSLVGLALAQDPAPEAAALEPAPAAPAPVTVAFVSETLPNGLKVSIRSDPDLPVVATQVWVQVGSAHEGPSEAGFAHLFEHLMFGATASHGKEEYSRHHTVHGGEENAYTSFDNTVYISQIGPAWHDEVLVLEADRMANLVLDADNLANEQKIVSEELRLRTENNPISRLLGPGLAALFGEHPYNHSPAGTLEDIAAADLDLVRKFYEGYYHPANMHLVVVGPVDAEATLARVGELFGSVDKQRLVPPEVPELATWDFPEAVTLAEDLPPIKVAVRAHAGPNRRAPDYWAYTVMVEMLAGGELDRFREHVVSERGKALEAVAFSEELRAGSIMGFATVSLPTRCRGKAFKLIDQSVEALDGGEWMSEANLETARRRLLRHELERSYYAESTAEAIGEAWAWQGDDSFALGGAVEAIDQVTLEQVRAAWQTYVLDAEPIELFIKRGKAGGAE